MRQREEDRKRRTEEETDGQERQGRRERRTGRWREGDRCRETGRQVQRWETGTETRDTVPGEQKG